MSPCFAIVQVYTPRAVIQRTQPGGRKVAHSVSTMRAEIMHRLKAQNAMLIIIAGFPAAFISMFFTGSLLIETIFSLDGLGLLGFESALNRDYPVMFGTLYIFTLLGLVLKIVSDITYTIVDPRIDFATRE